MSDSSLQRRLAQLMLFGVVGAAIVIALGWLWFVLSGSGRPPDDHLFHGEPKYLENLALMIRRAVDFSEPGHRHSLIMVGLALLLLNPLLRVGLAAVGFAQQKDALYAAICAIVLAVLLFSLFV